MDLYELLAHPILYGLVFGTPIAFVVRRVQRKLWRRPESQLRTVLVPTEDPINDRIEIFLSRD